MARDPNLGAAVSSSLSAHARTPASARTRPALELEPRGQDLSSNPRKPGQDSAQQESYESETATTNGHKNYKSLLVNGSSHESRPLQNGPLPEIVPCQRPRGCHSETSFPTRAYEKWTMDQEVGKMVKGQLVKIKLPRSAMAGTTNTTLTNISPCSTRLSTCTTQTNVTRAMVHLPKTPNSTQATVGE